VNEEQAAAFAETAIPREAFTKREHLVEHGVVIGMFAIGTVFLISAMFAGWFGWILGIAAFGVIGAAGYRLWYFYLLERGYESIRPLVVANAVLAYQRLLHDWNLDEFGRKPDFKEYTTVINTVLLGSRSMEHCFQRAQDRLFVNPMTELIQRVEAVEAKEREAAELESKMKLSIEDSAAQHGYCYAFSARNGIGDWVTKFGTAADQTLALRRISHAKKYLANAGFPIVAGAFVFAGSTTRERAVHDALRTAGYQTAKSLIEENEFSEQSEIHGTKGAGYTEFYKGLEPSTLLDVAASLGVHRLSPEAEAEIIRMSGVLNP